MKKQLKYCVPSVCALLICMIAEVITLLGTASQLTAARVEHLLNIILLTIAIISFFITYPPAKPDTDRDHAPFLSNLFVSGAAFVMNVAIYGHAIRLSHLWENLMCWNMCWSICTIIQVVTLTNFVSSISRCSCAILAWIKESCLAMRKARLDPNSTVEDSDKKTQKGKREADGKSCVRISDLVVICICLTLPLLVLCVFALDPQQIAAPSAQKVPSSFLGFVETLGKIAKLLLGWD